ncbi:Oidioi.mRNA.OKI2018_I69.chr1.g1305.t1.cds [Oikopleura dioica]|uniref:Oidioi.mRNA.OKI2018_I69.chr1.g1305.t1.cds n=1 Tax=Oikopleura dioica TaxID=34765 RepID=A0ABN7SUJ6_OIKDI|nr:Oidioi.mRNA.OKI2018_I69.chr1.g1305.t1.cds [Oikopleura dioica]
MRRKCKSFENVRKCKRSTKRYSKGYKYICYNKYNRRKHKTCGSGSEFVFIKIGRYDFQIGDLKCGCGIGNIEKRCESLDRSLPAARNSSDGFFESPEFWDEFFDNLPEDQDFEEMNETFTEPRSELENLLPKLEVLIEQ